MFHEIFFLLVEFLSETCQGSKVLILSLPLKGL